MAFTERYFSLIASSGMLIGLEPKKVVSIMQQTIRQSIIDLLKKEQVSVRDLSELFGCKEKELCEHLEHIARSLRPTNRFVIVAAQCKQCGFQFAKRTRFSPPSRCPKCKSEQIEKQKFSIR
ncbi:MAG: transcriptional regulator [Deltaproteobacteria bacterium]|nr:transcriptional regulator [Deltaproteobacteria bacterium]